MDDIMYKIYDGYIANLHNQKSPKESFRVALQDYANQQLAEYKSSLREQLKKRMDEADPIFSIVYMDILNVIK